MIPEIVGDEMAVRRKTAEKVAPTDKEIAPPSRDKRISLMKAIEANRGDRLLISYITSTRPGFEFQIADDVLPFFYQCLESGKAKAATGVDLFIHSNGGSGTAPWRIVNLIREYTKDFAVLVPHHAFSAATLIALGADKIIMHKMGCLGPIDPSVTNPFNPPHPQNPSQLIPISVEDVSAYFTLIKEDIGVQHEDELIQAVVALTEKIHPLALGNVQRSHNQSRMIAKKLLKKHMPKPEQEHEIEQLVEDLKSNLFFHGHPINRGEARDDLKLKVEDAEPTLESLMWFLYEEYAQELQIAERFNPIHEWEIRQPPPPTPPAPLTPLQMVRIENAKGAYLEAVYTANVFLIDLTIERTKINTPFGPQDATKQEVLWQRWRPTHEIEIDAEEGKKRVARRHRRTGYAV
jgi:Serine dehydrogenase proteinase